MSETILDELRAVVGDDHVIIDPEITASYERDWTGRYHGESAAVVRPGSTAEIAGIVRVCHEHRVAVVPQGGNTGLVGGSVPAAGQVVLSTQRAVGIREIDLEAGQATVEAGVTLSALGTALHTTGWEFGVDLAARDTATIGGMVATNAGGIRVLRYGSMRANVVGIEAVLGDGSIVGRLGGLLKDNTGYDLAGLLCGSEGTLGIVTAARLRLVPAWPDRLTVWIRCSGWADAQQLASALRREIDGLDGLEAVDAAGLALAGEVLGLEDPLGALEPDSVGLLVAWAGRGGPDARLAELVGDRRHAVAEDPTGAARLWAMRERQAEAIALIGIPHKLDVTLPVARLAEFATAVRSAVATSAPEARLFLFGHLGDGNLHVNVVGPDPDDPMIDELVLRLVAGMDGSISAEHGVGRTKARWLHLCRSPAELAAFRALKLALDPRGILNPGVLLTP
ncbi:MAG: FAD-binding oxidoreductase [Acidimicrobiia bacterium]